MSFALPEISVVVSAGQDDFHLCDCLRSLAAQKPMEIIVVNTVGSDVSAIPSTFPEVRVITAPRDALTPHLWKIGLNNARGKLVAFTTAGFIPASDWLGRIGKTLSDDDCAGLGGVIDPPQGADDTAAGWAVYFARYRTFLPGGATGIIVRHSLPGENAAYRRADLDRHVEVLQDGFWETLLQARLKAEHKRLLYDPQLRVRFGGARSLPLRMRYQHGLHYGLTRPLSTLRRLIYAAASPLLAMVLLWRIYRRVPGAMRRSFMRALPGLLVLIGAWSLGEAVGYLSSLRANSTSE